MFKVVIKLVKMLKATRHLANDVIIYVVTEKLTLASTHFQSLDFKLQFCFTAHCLLGHQ